MSIRHFPPYYQEAGYRPWAARAAVPCDRRGELPPECSDQYYHEEDDVDVSPDGTWKCRRCGEEG